MAKRPRPAPRVQLTKGAAQGVLGGHPWVWTDGLAEGGDGLCAGDEVELLDVLGAVIARGLAEGVLRPGAPAVRVLTRDLRDPPVPKLLFRRIAAARRLRERLLPPETTGFRLLHGEGDQLPGLVVDRYATTLVVRPDTEAWRPYRRAIVEALRAEGGTGIRSIVARERNAGGPELLWGEEPPETDVFSEAGRRYLVRPGRGQKTGFFLDQRPNRTRVQEWTQPGDRVLNLFSYTGGFSVAAALGGAASVASVDLSTSILDDCRRQFELNGLDPSPHRFVAEDIFAWLPNWAKRESKGAFDLVICDPPALAKRKSDVNKARAAYRRLHEGLAPAVARGGLLLTASCTARLGPEDLLEDARAGLRAGGRGLSRVLGSWGAGLDHPVAPAFPQGNYLSCLLLALD